MNIGYYSPGHPLEKHSIQAASVKSVLHMTGVLLTGKLLELEELLDHFPLRQLVLLTVFAVNACFFLSVIMQCLDHQ